MTICNRQLNLKDIVDKPNINQEERKKVIHLAKEKEDFDANVGDVFNIPSNLSAEGVNPPFVNLLDNETIKYIAKALYSKKIEQLIISQDNQFYDKDMT